MFRSMFMAKKGGSVSWRDESKNQTLSTPKALQRWPDEKLAKEATLARSNLISGDAEAESWLALLVEEQERRGVFSKSQLKPIQQPGEKMKTNEIKSGMRIRLANGWYGTMKDNLKGNTRMAEVEGLYTEIGSVYAHDIVSVQVGDVWHAVEHTPAQLKLKERVKRLGF